MLQLLSSLVGDGTSVDPIGDAAKLTDLLKTGGPWALLALSLIALTWAIKGRLTDAKEYAAQLKAAHDECAKALAAAALENRKSEEAKNDRVVAFAEKLAIVITSNTSTMERLADSVDNSRRA